MRYVYRKFVRLECLNLSTQFSVNRFYPASFYKRALQTLVPENADMGKDKVPYQLKTPKGTKDCMYLF